MKATVLGCVLASWFTPFAAASIALKDDLGRAVEMREPARRIVTLAPFLTELAFASGAGAQVVGVSAYSDYPPEARRLPQVATAAGFSIERIAALAPDLVLAWKDSFRPEDVERMARFGASVYVAEARRLEDVPRLLIAIGRLAGHDAGAPAARYVEELARLRREYSARRKLSVFLEIWHKPLTTVAGRHFINDALEICGARNVFDHLPGVAPTVSWEAVYARDPEVVVGVGSAASAAEFRAAWSARATLSAVKRDRLVFVAPDAIERPTTRTPAGIAALCEALERARSR